MGFWAVLLSMAAYVTLLQGDRVCNTYNIVLLSGNVVKVSECANYGDSTWAYSAKHLPYYGVVKLGYPTEVHLIQATGPVIWGVLTPKQDSLPDAP